MTFDLTTLTKSEIFLKLSRDAQVFFSPDCQRLAVQASDQVTILDSKNCEKIISFDGDISSFVITPWHYKGKNIAYFHDGAIEVRELQLG